MKSLLTSLIHGRAWHLSLLRIVLLSLLGWGVLRAANPQWTWDLGLTKEWPKTDFSKTLVDPREIESGGPSKDGIPAIDRPRFVSPAEADRWLDAREPVIALEIRGEARAYPLSILIFHEIVNDTVGGTPVAVTFCPLCNASIVFDRRVAGRLLDFGTTGRLRKSDLVMYDRQTESWWQQFTGQGIVGNYAGTRLTQLPSSIVAYADFKAAYPRGQVLSRETGHGRPYGRNPYRGYDRVGDQPFLFRDPADPRLPPMERVIGVAVGATMHIYPFSVLEKTPVINDEVAGRPVAIFSKAGTLSVLDEETIRASRTVPSATAFDRRVAGRSLSFELRDGTIRDRETGSTWNLFGQALEGSLKGQRLVPADSGVHFAFAWLAFNPQSEIYRPAVR
ncbi:MAG: DUF3179 domain-containing protein [Betaproteobacteria bacterium]|nr:DUF3179 domain-containing protein [Betaproteobacteria bacterium]